MMKTANIATEAADASRPNWSTSTSLALGVAARLVPFAAGCAAAMGRLPDCRKVSFNHAAIAAIAHMDPPNVVSNDDVLRELAPVFERTGVPTDALGRAGVRTRKEWDGAMTHSDGATQVGEMALAKSGIAKERVGVLIYASVGRETKEPATAAVVHHKMGALGRGEWAGALGFLHVTYLLCARQVGVDTGDT